MQDGSCDLDPGEQTRRCFEIVATALADVGASLDDVGHVAPAARMVVVAGLLDPHWTVEIEVDAVTS